MVWGPLIAWYLFLAGAAAGAFITAAIVEAKYPDARIMRIGGRILAPVMLGVGLIMLMVDAEAGLMNPLRFFGLVMNPGSVMTLGVYIICVFMPVALIVVVFDLLKKRIPKWLTWIGIVSGICLAAYTGFLLGVAQAFPLWNNAMLPLLFVASAFSAGLAATSLVGLIAERTQFEGMTLLKKSHVVLAGAEGIILAIMLTIVAASGNAGSVSVFDMVAGSFAPAFWIGIVLFGLVIPLIAGLCGLRSAKQEGANSASLALDVVAEIGALVGSFLLRYVIVAAALPIILF